MSGASQAQETESVDYEAVQFAVGALNLVLLTECLWHHQQLVEWQIELLYPEVMSFVLPPWVPLEMIWELQVLHSYSLGPLISIA